MIDYRDRAKAITAEDLIRRYKLDSLETDRKAIKTIDGMLTKTNTLIKDYIINLSKYTDSQAEKVTAWFFSGYPSIETALNNDFYYGQESGKVYQLQDSAWVEIKDVKLTESLALANATADTFDNKRTLFYSTPSPPYEIGDVWYENSTIKRCRCNRTEQEFNELDWCIQDEYSDTFVLLETTAILDDFKEEVRTDYVTKATHEVDKDSIVSLVENTTTQTREITKNQIDNVVTLSNNNYQELNAKIGDLATSTEVVEIKNAVEILQTSTEASIKVINETFENGVSKVKTEKGFTFDDEGMTVDEINSPTKSITDTNGITVVDKTGSANAELLFAGYDSETMQSIVRTMNLWVKTYFMLGNNNTSGDWRIEIVEDSEKGIGLGFFNMEGD